MKQLMIPILMLLGYTSLNAQSFEWARSFGGSNSEWPTDIKTDHLGNVYSIGYFEDSVDFDPGPGVDMRYSNGSQDYYIQKLDNNGNLVWVKSFGGISQDQALSLDIDQIGNVYITGFFVDTVDFDPGPNIFELVSRQPIPSFFNPSTFIQKLDTNGDFVWANAFGCGCSFDDILKIDQDNNVITAGRFNGSSSFDFDPSPTSSFILSSGPQGDAIYVQKLDSNGVFIWAKALGAGASNLKLDAFDTDANNNIFIGGTFGDSLQVDVGEFVFANGFDAAFIQKIDANGNFVWGYAYGSSNGSNSEVVKPYDMVIDGAGNIFTVGTFKFLAPADFDPDTAAVFNLTPTSSTLDLYIQKLDSNGVFVWAKQYGSPGIVIPSSIQKNVTGNLYIGGYFEGTVDVDPDTSAYNLSSLGSADIFVTKLDNDGNFNWGRSFGNINGYEISNGLALDDSGNVFNLGIMGDDPNGIDFNPGTGTYMLYGNGFQDVFIQKLGPCTALTGTDQQSACSSYTWIDGITYTSSNNTATYEYPVGSYYGCDSIVTLNLTITGPANGTDVQSACNSYQWIDGQTYTSNNNTATYTFTGGSVNGCDSVVTLDLTINAPSTGTDVQTACGSYQWIDGQTYTSNNNSATFTVSGGAANGCDSVVTLDLTILSPASSTDVQTACGSYTWIDGQTYTSNNNSATFTLTGGAANGCDSVITLNLTINAVSDNTVAQNGATLTANNGNATYQWIDCDNGNAAISGATAQVYTATANGNYAVVLTENGCTDTSACVNVVLSSIGSMNMQEVVKVYPNPTSGLLNIDFGAMQAEATLQVYDARGVAVQRFEISNTAAGQVQLPTVSGMYMIVVHTAEGMARFSVLRE